MNKGTILLTLSKGPMPRPWKRALWRKEIDLRYRPFHDEMVARGADQYELHEYSREWGNELSSIEEQVEVELTDMLIRKAERYRLAVPPRTGDSGNWMTTWPAGFPVLSDNAIRKLREDIRIEEKWKRESWAFRIAVMSAFTGLIGAATGLVALLIR